MSATLLGPPCRHLPGDGDLGLDVDHPDASTTELRLRRFLNVYVNSEDIRFLDNQATALADGDEVSIVPAVAGG